MVSVCRGYDGMTAFSDFDVDFKYGSIREKRLAEILENCTVEVKTERNQWSNTGNIAIEYEYKNRPSGIAVTKADYWCHVLAIDDIDCCMLLFKTDHLKQLIKTSNYRGVIGGDDNQSKMVLVPLADIFTDLASRCHDEITGEENNASI